MENYLPMNIPKSHNLIDLYLLNTVDLLELFKLEAHFVLRPGQHANDMEENTNYRSLQCNSLGLILKILKVGRGCLNVGSRCKKCFE